MPKETLRDVLGQRFIVVVTPSDTVAFAARRMAERRTGSVLLIDDQGKLVGIFTERDLVTRVVARGLDPAKTPLSQVATTDLLAAKPEDTVEETLGVMKEAGIRHLPVVSEGMLLGIVSMRDLSLLHIGNQRTELHRMRERPAYVREAAGPMHLVWKCLRCGHLEPSAEPPDQCPHCHAPRTEFVHVEED